MVNITIESIRNLFFEFTSRLSFYERKFLKNYGITDISPNEAKILHLIGTLNDKSMSDIADRLKITYGTLSTTINGLVKKGYVIRTRRKPDRRVIILYLTQKCLTVIKRHETFHFELINKLMQTLTKGKTIVLNEILVKLNNFVETDLCKGTI